MLLLQPSPLKHSTSIQSDILIQILLNNTECMSVLSAHSFLRTLRMLLSYITLSIYVFYFFHRHCRHRRRCFPISINAQLLIAFHSISFQSPFQKDFIVFAIHTHKHNIKAEKLSSECTPSRHPVVTDRRLDIRNVHFMLECMCERGSVEKRKKESEREGQLKRKKKKKELERKNKLY